MNNKYGFILIKPQLGENIGSSARAMKNFGFKNLLITNPRDGWPNVKARATSVGAFDILNKTKVFKSTDSIIKKFDIIFSFSARKRDINKKHIGITTFLEKIKKIKSKKIGLMFGPEASGLSNFDLSYSDYIVQIPSSPKFKSLNLSHSVTVVCYEIFKVLNNKSHERNKTNLKISSKMKINSFIDHLLKLLEEKSFFLPKEKKQSMLLNINNLIYRLEPNNKELRILASIISSLSKKNIKP